MAGTSGTKLYTLQDAVNAVLAGNAQSADTNPMGLMDMGRYVATPTAVADGQYVTVLLNKLGYPIPDRQSVLLFTTTTGGTGTFTSTAFGNIGAFQNLEVLIDVTATGGSTATLTSFIDSRIDGTTWVNLAQGGTMTTASVQVLHLTKQNPATAITITADAGVGTVRAIGWSDDIRFRYSVGGATSTFTFRVFVCGAG